MDRFPPIVPRALLAAAVAGLVTVAAACGDGASDLDLSADAAEGRRIANSSGCGACHGSGGQGGLGPAFVGLYGAQVELEDGSTVTADDAYLAESITDPSARRVAGYDLRMPSNDLDDDEVLAVIAYIRELEATP